MTLTYQPKGNRKPGRPKERSPEAKRVAVYLEPEVFEKFKFICQTEDITMNGVIEDEVNEFVKQRMENDSDLLAVYNSRHTPEKLVLPQGNLSD